MHRTHLPLMVLVLLATVALATPLLTAHRFHPDEALFAWYGLQIQTGPDPLLAGQAVDKPPLLFYLLAGSFTVFGRHELAARLPAFLAAPIDVALMYAWIRHSSIFLSSCRGDFNRPVQGAFPSWGQACRASCLTCSERAAGKLPNLPYLVRPQREMHPSIAGLLCSIQGLSAPETLAALSLALSPYHVAFSSTAFTDPLFVTFTLAALVCVRHRRPGWAGIFLGLAFATKAQAILFWPFAIVYLWTQVHRSGMRLLWRSFCHFGIGLATLPVMVVLWDHLRARPRSLWAEAAASYGGLSLVRLADLPSRLIAWRTSIIALCGLPMLAGLLLVGAVILLTGQRHRLPRLREAGGGLLSREGVFRPDASALRSPLDSFASPVSTTGEGSRLIVVFLVVYLGLHLCLTVQPWDRYLLGLAPLVTVLIGDSLSRLPGIPRLVCLLFLLPTALGAATGQLPLGSLHGTYDGLDPVTAYLRLRPWGTVVYDHWLDWELRFYLADDLLFLNWQPTPQSLAQDLLAFGAQPPRYLVVPDWRSVEADRQAIQSAGFQIHPVLVTQPGDGGASMTLYEIRRSSLTHE